MPARCWSPADVFLFVTVIPLILVISISLVVLPAENFMLLDPAQLEQLRLPWWVHLLCGSRWSLAGIAASLLAWFGLTIRNSFTAHARAQSNKEILAEQAVLPEESFSAVDAPMVSMVMPVKLAGMKAGSPEDNWRCQLKTGYPGRMEYIFVTETDTEAAFHAVQRLRQSCGDSHSIRTVQAGKATDTGQKVHNMLAGLEACDPTSAYVHFVDVNCQLHPGTVGTLVGKLEADPKVFVASGFPLDIPAEGATLWAWVMCHFRYMTGLCSLNCENFNLVWGGCMLLRKSDLDGDRYKIKSILGDRSFSDDVLIQGAAEDNGAAMATPLRAIFPNPMRPNISFQTAFYFVRRQIFNLRSFRSTSSALRQLSLAMMLVLVGGFTVLGVSLTAAALVCACLHPLAVLSYPAFFAGVLFFGVWVLAGAAQERQVFRGAYTTCGLLSPERKMPSVEHMGLPIFALSMVVASCLLIPALLLAYLVSTVNWGGIVYRIRWGKIVEIRHPAASPIALMPTRRRRSVKITTGNSELSKKVFLAAGEPLQYCLQMGTLICTAMLLSAATGDALAIA